MVDVGHKPASKRKAVAMANVSMPSSVVKELEGGEIHSKKGPVFATAIIAGTMAVKQTSSLIPFCHPLPIDNVSIAIAVKDDGLVVIECSVESLGRTGVELEALTGASIAALTIFDMCKSIAKDIIVGEIKVIEKTGGTRDSHALAK